jgi:hypothetical protein
MSTSRQVADRGGADDEEKLPPPQVETAASTAQQVSIAWSLVPAMGAE